MYFKVEIMQQILTDENAYAKEMVFIGDSKEDLQSSISQGVEFIGRRSNRPLNCNSNHIYPVGRLSEQTPGNVLFWKKFSPSESSRINLIIDYSRDQHYNY